MYEYVHTHILKYLDRCRNEYINTQNGRVRASRRAVGGKG